jgi:hypothetical protein
MVSPLQLDFIAFTQALNGCIISRGIEMQFGNAKSIWPPFLLATLIAASITLPLAYWKCIALEKAVILFCSLGGTILLASAFTPQGLFPPQGTLLKKISWFFKGQGAVPVYYNRPIFFGGLVFLAISFILTAII